VKATRHMRLASDFVSDAIAPDSFFCPGAITPEFYACLPDKIQRRHLTNEEQDLIIKFKRRRLSLDPLHELAHEKLLLRLTSRPDRASSTSSLFNFDNDSYLDLPPRPRSAGTMTATRPAISGTRDGDRPSRNSIYDSFRWLEDDEELDLRLYLDDYHANLRSEIPLNDKGRRPSFRRHMSVSRSPFGQLPNLTIKVPTRGPSARSPTNDVIASAALPSAYVSSSRKQQTLSVSMSKDAPSSYHSFLFEGPAAHYHDPDARLKLRAFITSPQKFDEAIALGFPATDAFAPRSNLDNRSGSRCQRRDEDDLQTFLVDDRSSIYSDDGSDGDPDFPLTPVIGEDLSKPIVMFSRPARTTPEPMVTDPAREMTLRMTLTRPDLRADEHQMYGWQQQKTSVSQPRKSTSATLRDGVGSSHSTGEPSTRYHVQRHLDAIALECQSEERGVIRRIWNKVRRQ